MAKEKKIIIDYLTGKEIDVTKKPEELVRQEYIKRLAEEYGYPKNHIAKEVAINAFSGKHIGWADIVIYKDEKQNKDNAYIIVECKKQDRKEGEDQLKDYARLTSCDIAVWHNGSDDTLYWQVIDKPKNKFEPRIYLPRYGEFYGDKKILKKELRPASDLQKRFSRIHDHIYANTKSSDKTWVFNQMLYLIFAKMYDEKQFTDKCEFFINDKEAKEILDRSKSESFRKRLWGLFERVKTDPDFEDVFSGREEIELEQEQVAYIISELEYLSILYTDVKGEAFQAFINNYFRGDAGQFFTPDPIKHLVVKILDPQPDEVVLDPACGSSGFLVAAINHFRNLLKKRDGLTDKDNNPLSDTDIEPKDKKLLAKEIKAIADKHIKGIDFDNNLTKIAKMYMVMVDDGHTGIHTINSLLPFSEIEKATNKDIKREVADVIMTNPPFGSKGKIGRKEILSNFDFGYKWTKDKETGEFKVEKVEKNLVGGKKKGDGQVPDILFIERCVELLKSNGRMAIVLPDGDLTNQNTEFVRYWLKGKVQIVAVISLPQETFVPFGAGVKPSVLIVKKSKPLPEEKYPVFFAEMGKIGYDIRGRKTFKRNEQGEVVNSKGEVINQSQESIEKYGAVDTDEPVILENWEKFRKDFKKYLW